LFLIPAVLLAAACDDRSDPLGPGEPVAGEASAPAPEHPSGTLENFANWADGYLRADPAEGSSYQPSSGTAYNRSGGAMSVTKVAGTRGRYVVRFSGLSALIGKNTVRVTGSVDDVNYCKPVGGSLVRDSVEVRCFRMGTGAAAEAAFFLQVIGKRDDRAFAFGNQPTATNYAPASAGSWNPAGATRVYREALGRYRAVFTGLGARLPANVGGHVQVVGVGTAKSYCNVETWGGSPDLSVYVGCYTPAGVPVDAKFAVLFTQPAAHLAYAWAESATAALYQAYAVYATNPAGGAITLRRYGVGRYQIDWTGVDAQIRDYGTPQVTAWGETNAHCKVYTYSTDYVTVRCYAPNGVPMDAQYMVSLGS
jgi:hypothetical protein